MYTILLATNNLNKVTEINEILNHYNLNNFNVINVTDLEKSIGYSLGEPIEDGLTFKDNAYIKANYYKKMYNNYLVVSDDTGLMVDALNGMPGVHSKRYSDPDATHEKNRIKLLNALKDIKEFDKRSAHFETCVCLIDENNIEHYFYGKVEGYILDEENGEKGFGYDSLFYSKELNKCFAECDNEEKSSVSHRGRAIRALIEYLKDNYK